MSDLTQTIPQDSEARFGDYVALLKPRVMSLVVFTALVGWIAAPVGAHPFEAFVAILCIAIGGGASGALNMWWDADIDAVMKRTRSRPIPAGRLAPGDALALGLALAGFAVVFLGLATNWAAAGLLAFTIFYYVVVYSMWLKRSTPQNIVIGGAAGAFPPMVAWLAATGSLSLEPVLMFLLIFMWTPPHFWALNLFVKTDYGDAGVPMLADTHGREATRNHIMGYTIALVAVALGLAFTPVGGPLYLAVALLLNLRFLGAAWRVWRRDDAACEADQHLAERQLFKASLLYLFLHFGAIMAEAILTPIGYGGWGWL